MKKSALLLTAVLLLAGAVVWLRDGGSDAPQAPSPVDRRMGEMEFYRAQGRHLMGRSSGRAALFRCLNLTGLEFGTPYGGISLPEYPGVLGTDYFLPRPEDFEAAAGHGFNCLRLPVEWARLVPAAKPQSPPDANFSLELDEVYLGHIKTALDLAGQAGLQVVLDLHSFAKYWAGRDEDNYNSVLCLDDAWQPQDQRLRRLLERTWALLASEFAQDVRVLGYDIMNEPVREELHLDYPEVCQSCNWTEIAQGVVEAVRDFDRRHLIFVEGKNFSLASHWVTENGPRPFIVDRDSAGEPLDPPGIVYSPHLYFDRDNDSRYWDLGEDEGPLGPWKDYVRERILPVIEWSLENEVPLFIGETGVPCNEEWAQVLEHAYAQYFDRYRVSLALWQYAAPERCPLRNEEGGRECSLNMAACPGGWQFEAARRHPGGRYQPAQAPVPQPGPSRLYAGARLNPWDVGPGYYGGVEVDFRAAQQSPLGASAAPQNEASASAAQVSAQTASSRDAAGPTIGGRTAESGPRNQETSGRDEATAAGQPGRRAIALRFPAREGHHAALKFTHRWGLDARRYGELRFRVRFAEEGPIPELVFFSTRPVPDCSPRFDTEYPAFEVRARLSEYVRNPAAGRWYDVAVPLRRIAHPRHPVISGLAFQIVSPGGGLLMLDDIRFTPSPPSWWPWP